MNKLYIILDAALASGAKMAQTAHAAFTMAMSHPELVKQWHETSNNIVVLEHQELPAVAGELETLGLKVSRFHEPDFGDALTAIAVEPRAWRYVSNIRLAG